MLCYEIILYSATNGKAERLFSAIKLLNNSDHIEHLHQCFVSGIGYPHHKEMSNFSPHNCLLLFLSSCAIIRTMICILPWFFVLPFRVLLPPAEMKQKKLRKLLPEIKKRTGDDFHTNNGHYDRHPSKRQKHILPKSFARICPDQSRHTPHAQ